MKELNSLPAFQRMASRPADRTLVYIRTRAQLVVSALMLIIALPNHGGETESPPGSHHELTNLLPLQERSVAITSAPGAPLDMVFIFGSEIVSPQKQMIHLPAVLEVTDAPASLETLVSTLSPHTGFQSLRTWQPETREGPLEFSIPQTAARWIMLRITPAPEAGHISLTEISIIGHTGPPATHYSFKESLARAFAVLEKLKETVNVNLSADEIALFADVQDGKLDDWSFAEAALIACRELPRAEFEHNMGYIAQKWLKEAETTEGPEAADQIVILLREEFADSKRYSERLRTIMRSLHKNTLARGISRMP